MRAGLKPSLGKIKEASDVTWVTCHSTFVCTRSWPPRFAAVEAVWTPEIVRSAPVAQLSCLSAQIRIHVAPERLYPDVPSLRLSVSSPRSGLQLSPSQDSAFQHKLCGHLKAVYRSLFHQLLIKLTGKNSRNNARLLNIPFRFISYVNSA